MIGKDLNNQEKLEAIYKMTLENNDILRVIRRQQYFSNALRLLYWLVVLGAIGSAYYFIRPLVTTLSSNSGKIEEAASQFSQIRDQLPETKLVNQLLERFKSKGATTTATDNQMPDDGVIDASTSVTQ